jgi:hypothetical protein
MQNSKNIIDKFSEEQSMKMILLNEQFYDSMEEEPFSSQHETINQILSESKDMEKECLDLKWIPFLYSIIARCHFGLGDIDAAIVYSRDSIAFSKLEAYMQLLEPGEKNNNLHPLKTQRDISMGVNDIEKVLTLQKQVMEVTPYILEEKEFMSSLIEMKPFMRQRQLTTSYTSYDDRCLEIDWETDVMKLDTLGKIREEESLRANKIMTTK